MPPPARILIVEDEEILARNLQRFLARTSQDVRVALNAEQAMEMLASFTPDIVVLDFALPGTDGLQTYAGIVRGTAPRYGCVMITGHFTEEVARAAGEHGIGHILCKPFSFAELLDRIARNIGEMPPGPFPGGAMMPCNPPC